jgi:hypothetical protein
MNSIDVVVCSCNECCQQLLWPMSCIISIYFLTVQHYPENPTQHDLSSGQYGHPVQQAQSWTLDWWWCSFRGICPIPVRWNLVRWTTEPLLRDLWVIFRDIDCVWCWKLEVQSFEVLSLAIGVCMAITAADARVWRCLWVLGMGHWFWSNAEVPGWRTDKLM